MYNILIIGFGNIGFYHFLSLYNQNKYKFSFHIVDSKSQCLKKLKKYKNNKIFVYKNIDVLPKLKYEFLILATTVNDRFSIFKKFINLNNVKYIIFEKIVFNSLEEIKNAKKIINQKKINSWVNCNYQSVTFFNKLKYQIGKKKFEFKVFGGNWSLGTSAIHFFDLFVYLSQSSIKKVNFKSHSKKLNKSKRPGYFEFDGVYSGYSKNGNKFSIEKFNNSKMPLYISITTKDYFLIFEDTFSKANIFTNKNNWNFKRINISFPLQSQLTYRIIDEIISHRKCSLPKFQTSIENHALMLKSLRKEFLNTKLINHDKVNIT